MIMTDCEKCGDLKVICDSVERFSNIQRYMTLAKKENAVETYDALKIDYKCLKVILQACGVDLTELDIIRE